jgi:hypothetical protein
MIIPRHPIRPTRRKCARRPIPIGSPESNVTRAAALDLLEEGGDLLFIVIRRIGIATGMIVRQKNTKRPSLTWSDRNASISRS